MIKIRDKERFVRGLLKGKYTIRNASAILKQDEEVLFLCATHDKENYVLSEVPSEKLKDMPFVVKILGIAAKNFKVLDDNLRYDKDFIVAMCEKNPDIVLYIPEKLRTDVDLMKDVASANGLCIKNIDSGVLSRERDVNFLAVNNNAFAYKFVHPNFIDDFAIAKLAVTKRAVNFFYLPPEYRENPEIIKACFQDAPTYTYYIYKDKLSEKMKRDVGVSLYACRSNLKCLLEVPSQTFLNASFKRGFNSYILSQEKELSELDDGGVKLQEFKQSLSDLLEQKKEVIFKERVARAGERAEAQEAELEFINSLTQERLEESDEKDGARETKEKKDDEEEEEESEEE